MATNETNFAHTPGVPVIAILHTGAKGVFRRQIEELKDSLEDAGLEINEDVEVNDTYWNEDGTPAELAALAAKVFSDTPAADLKVVVAAGGPASALAAKAARGTGITPPIVFTTIFDPVRAGLRPTSRHRRPASPEWPDLRPNSTWSDCDCCSTSCKAR